MTHCEPSASRTDRRFAVLHSLLPTHLLSRATHALARCQRRWLKDRLNRYFVERYQIDLSEAESDNLADYPSFNALFTRSLRPGARPLTAEAEAVVSPTDGTISAIGHLDGEQLLQAKGIRYSLSELLGGLDARPFAGGAFATIYLSPRDYHRIHAPVDCRLRATQYVPGRLLTVAPPAVRAIRQLFLRNERLATLWETPLGPLALVAVGAVNVGSIETVWATSADRSLRGRHDYENDAPSLPRGAELGRFNLGSTVILVLPSQSVTWRGDLAVGSRLKMGEPLGYAPAPRAADR